MRRLSALFLWLCAGACLLAAGEPAATVDQQIEALLAKVAQQTSVQFVRNGAAHDAAAAVQFLRGKWERNRSEVKTMQDFIDKIATKSSTTGQPYLIRFKDGKEIECRDFLRQLLTAP